MNNPRPDLDALVMVHADRPWPELLEQVWQYCRAQPADREAALNYLLAHPDESARRAARILKEGRQESLYCRRCGCNRWCLLVEDPASHMPDGDCIVAGINNSLRWLRRERLCLTCGGRFATAELDEDLLRSHLKLREVLEQMKRMLDNTPNAAQLAEFERLLKPLHELKSIEEYFRARSVSVDSLGLSVRLGNILGAENIDTLDQLCAFGADELLAFRHMDAEKLAELRQQMAKRGLKLRAD